MKGSGVNVQFDRHSSPHKAAPIFQVFFKKEIKRPGGQIGRRQTVEIARAGRRCVARNIIPAWLMAQQARPAKPVAVCVPYEMACMRMGVRGRARPVIEHWIDQMLERERIFTPIPDE